VRSKEGDRRGSSSTVMSVRECALWSESFPSSSTASVAQEGAKVKRGLGLGTGKMAWICLESEEGEGRDSGAELGCAHGGKCRIRTCAEGGGGGEGGWKVTRGGEGCPRGPGRGDFGEYYSDLGGILVKRSGGSGK